MANAVRSSVVDIVRDGLHNTLDDYLAKNAYPIDSFMGEDGDIRSAISRALTYMKSQGYGTVTIPKTESTEWAMFEVITNSDNTISIRSFGKNYRFPINDEKVPYTGSDWQIGDIVINSDLNNNKCLGWVYGEYKDGYCWYQFGSISPFNNYIEELDYLPEPSVLQLGRQVRYKLGELQGLFICRWDGGQCKWCQQDYLQGPESLRPATAPNGTWFYNTTVDRYEWYSEKDSKWYRFEQMESEFARWENSVNALLDDLRSQIEVALNDANKELDSMIEQAQISIDGKLEEFDRNANQVIEEVRVALDNTVDRVVEESQQRVDNALAGVSEATNRANQAANDAIEKTKDYQNQVEKMIIIRKGIVNTFDDIATKYPNPENGWTVKVEDSGYFYRYDGFSGKWEIVDSSNSLVVEQFSKKAIYYDRLISTVWSDSIQVFPIDGISINDTVEIFVTNGNTEDCHEQYNNLELDGHIEDGSVVLRYFGTPNTVDIPITLRVTKE